MLERLRYWIANAICPPVHVCAQYRGLQHIDKDVKLKPLIRVRVMEPKDIPDSGVEFIEGRKLSQAEVVALIDSATGKGEPLDLGEAELVNRPVPQDVVDELRRQVVKDGLKRELPDL